MLILKLTSLVDCYASGDTVTILRLSILETTTPRLTNCEPSPETSSAGMKLAPLRETGEKDVRLTSFVSFLQASGYQATETKLGPVEESQATQPEGSNNLHAVGNWL